MREGVTDLISWLVQGAPKQTVSALAGAHGLSLPAQDKATQISRSGLCLVWRWIRTASAAMQPSGSSRTRSGRPDTPSSCWQSGLSESSLPQSKFSQVAAEHHPVAVCGPWGFPASLTIYATSKTKQDCHWRAFHQYIWLGRVQAWQWPFSLITPAAGTTVNVPLIKILTGFLPKKSLISPCCGHKASFLDANVNFQMLVF